ncbi:hypothetical protein LguiA_011511 [Lonicera macranthoides]
MLRNRSKTVTTKQQPLMADQNSLPSPTQDQTRPISSFFGSPRFLNGFLTKGVSDPEVSMSPTSILDNKQFSNFVKNPFGHDKKLTKPTNTSPENTHIYKKLDSQGIGLALVDEKTDDDLTKTNNRMVLFGSKLKIQIPNLPSCVISSTYSPTSPADFGIKTRNSQFLRTSPAFGTANSCVQTNDSPPVSLSISEIELSEDYTCIISHGPNPRTTRIYDNCIVETYFGANELSQLKDECNLESKSKSFLSLSQNCNKNL